MDVFDLSAKITLDTKDYDNGLNNAEKSGKGFASKLGGGLKTAAKVGGAAIGAVSAVTGVMAKKFVDGVKATSEYGDNVDKMSQKIGISAKSYQQWDYVMQRAGMSIDTMKMGMKTLSKQAEDNSDSFQKLGISQEEVKKLSQEELFEKTIAGLSKMEAGTERTKLATELLGKAGSDMGPLLNEGTKEIEKQKKMAEDYGMVMSDKAVKASAQFQDSLTTMKMTLGGLKNRMMSGFLPAVTKVTDGLAKLFTGDMSGLDNITKGIDKIVGKISDMMPKIVEVGGKILEALGNAILENAPKLVPVAVDIIMDLVQYVMDALPKLMELGVEIISQLITAIADAIPKLTDSAADIVLSLASAVIENLPTIIKAGLDLLVGLAKGIIKAIPKIVKELPKLIKALVEGLLSAIPDIIQAGIDLLTSLVDNLPEIIDTIVAAIPDIIKGIIDAVLDNIDKIIDAGVDLLTALVDDLPTIIETIVDAVPKIISGLFDALTDPKTLEKIIKAGFKIAGKIVKGIFKFAVELPERLFKFVKKIAKALTDPKKAIEALKKAGKAIITAVWKGISAAWKWIKEKILAIVNWISEQFKKAINAVQDFIGELGIGESEAQAKASRIANREKIAKKQNWYLDPKTGEFDSSRNYDGTKKMGKKLSGNVLAGAVSIKGTEVDNSEKIIEAIENLTDVVEKNSQNNTKIVLNNREFGRAVREYA